MQNPTKNIVYTGKLSKKCAKFQDRCERIHGKSYAEAIGTMYLDNGKWVKYKRADYQYDVKYGYIQHAMLAQCEATPEEAYVAYLEAQNWCESAMLTVEGGDPINRARLLWHQGPED